jgi:23S rRNA pseudouridine2604 synthase
MAFVRRYEEAEPQRVNRWLAQSGVCSRREAEALITRGLVSIDGERVDDVGRKIAPGQTLTLADEAQAAIEGAVTIILNKPRGVVSANPERGQIPAIQLVSQRTLFGPGFPAPREEDGLAPLGRLDKDSRGLLLLSNDRSRLPPGQGIPGGGARRDHAAQTRLVAARP